jgi:hypothetical protein
VVPGDDPMLLDDVAEVVGGCDAHHPDQRLRRPGRDQRPLV